MSYDFVEPIEKLVKYSNGLTALEMENNQGHTPVELARDAAAKDPKWDLQRTGVAGQYSVIGCWHGLAFAPLVVELLKRRLF